MKKRTGFHRGVSGVLKLVLQKRAHPPEREAVMADRPEADTT